MWAPIPSETITSHSSMGPIQEIGLTNTALQVGANAPTLGGLFLGDRPQAQMPIELLASLTGLQSPPTTDLALEPVDSCSLVKCLWKVGVSRVSQCRRRSITTGKNRAAQTDIIPISVTSSLARKDSGPC